MGGGAPLEIQGAVEGDLDAAVLSRLAREVGARPSAIYGRTGKAALLRSLSGYNRAAARGPWVALLDLDSESECVPDYAARCLPQPAATMVFRVIVREVEAWLMADAEALARFLSVPEGRVPRDPEALLDPKETLVNLARRSRRRAITDDMVPRPTSGRPIGPAYTSRMVEFVDESWRPRVAAGRSPGLDRCLTRMTELVQRHRRG